MNICVVSSICNFGRAADLGAPLAEASHRVKCSTLANAMAYLNGPAKFLTCPDENVLDTT